MSQYAALEARPDLALDEAGDGGAVESRSCEEWQELSTDDLMGQRLLGVAAEIFGDD